VKLLLDACVWGGARMQLEAAGHDVLWAGDWPEDPGDDAILGRAHGEGRTLITLDKDFGRLAVFRGAAHCGILRLVNIGARQQGEICKYVIERYGNELAVGAIVTVDPGRLRIRPADETTAAEE